MTVELSDGKSILASELVEDDDEEAKVGKKLPKEASEDAEETAEEEPTGVSGGKE